MEGDKEKETQGDKGSAGDGTVRARRARVGVGGGDTSPTDAQWHCFQVCPADPPPHHMVTPTWGFFAPLRPIRVSPTFKGYTKAPSSVASLLKFTRYLENTVRRGGGAGRDE